ncbi:VOC family protein [Methylovorus sp. MP688]|uniref:VOC family protein n=1 Tax=Methylovorus sp. (strain MP688) TaxID=887061 RepID=UPI00059D8798|nr:VOC family protein [Methylovorus sp. MP688]
MPPVLGTIIIYARNIQASAAFYSKYFGFHTSGEVIDGLIELINPRGGASILIHQAAKSVKLGQAGLKLSFDVEDINDFILSARVNGLEFGSIHEANGYSFANVKDPDGNSVSISSRKFRNTA